jgi:hypothetical protein
MSPALARPLRITAVLAALVVQAACAKHPGSYEAATTPAGVAEASATADALRMFEARADGAELEKSLLAFEKVLAANPTDRVALEYLTRGWYFYGDGYTDDKAVKIERWGKAISYGTRCIAQNTEIASKIAAGEKEKDAIAAARPEDAMCIYWTASALGKWGKEQSLSTTLKHLPTVKAYIAKVEEMDPTIWYYGPARYWGAYYAAIPSFAGRDTEVSAKYFDTSLKGAPNYLGTRVLRAELNAVAAQDPALFLTDLYAVLQSDPYALPEIAAENLREQDKARNLLAKKGELFDKDALATALAAHPEPVFPTFRPPEAPAASVAAPAVAERPADAPAPAAADDTKERPADDGGAQ